MLPGEQVAFVSEAILLCNVLIALAVLVATGFVTERWARNRGGARADSSSMPLQFGLRALLLLTVVVAVMSAAAYADPSLWRSAEGFLVWLLSGFLGYGVACSICVIGSITTRVGRFLPTGWLVRVQKNQWCRAHLTTCFTVVSVIAAVVVFNVRGRGDAPWPIWSIGWGGLNDPQSVEARQFDFQNARWEHGWPITYLERNCYSYGVFKGVAQYTRRPQWCWLPNALGMTAGEGDVFFNDALLWCDALIGLLVVAATGLVTDRLVKSRRDALAKSASKPLQFGLRTLLLLVVVVAVMSAAAHADPSLWRSVGGVLIWLLSALLGYGVACLICVVALGAAGIARILRARRPSGQQQ